MVWAPDRWAHSAITWVSAMFDYLRFARHSGTVSKVT
jgi:hypothetical protein